MRSDDIRHYQFLLRRAGYSTPVTGVEDAVSTKTLKIFQRDIGLEPSGVFCNGTTKALDRYQ